MSGVVRVLCLAVVEMGIVIVALSEGRRRRLCIAAWDVVETRVISRTSPIKGSCRPLSCTTILWYVTHGVVSLIQVTCYLLPHLLLDASRFCHRSISTDA